MGAGSATTRLNRPDGPDAAFSQENRRHDDARLDDTDKGRRVLAMRHVGIGLLGAGSISDAYLRASRHFPFLDIRGIASAGGVSARERAYSFGLQAVTPEELLSDPSIEIIVNLTPPAEHARVGLAVLRAGKHLYSEKPLAATFEAAALILEEAAARKLRVGCAPDTFLGGAHQVCRRLVDEGALGKPIGGTAFFLCPGHERWHPNPGFYYAPGGGPILDMGPYHITILVHLLGPVARVTGLATRGFDNRIIPSGPGRGTSIPVQVQTHVSSSLQFASGAVVSMSLSFDVQAHQHSPIEIYGTEASLLVPDPHRFGGSVQIGRNRTQWHDVPIDRPFHDDDYRMIGVADLALAIQQGQPHRADGALALHTLEVLEGIMSSAQSGSHVDIKTRPRRPPMLPDEYFSAGL